MGSHIGAVTKNPSNVTIFDDHYTYDGNNNQLTHTSFATTTNYTVNETNELTNNGATTQSFDGNGNQTASSAGQSGSYNSMDQTTSYTPAGGSALSLGYADIAQDELATMGARRCASRRLGSREARVVQRRSSGTATPTATSSARRTAAMPRSTSRSTAKAT